MSCFIYVLILENFVDQQSKANVVVVVFLLVKGSRKGSRVQFGKKGKKVQWKKE